MTSSYTNSVETNSHKIAVVNSYAVSDSTWSLLSFLTVAGRTSGFYRLSYIRKCSNLKKWLLDELASKLMEHFRLLDELASKLILDFSL